MATLIVIDNGQQGYSETGQWYDSTPGYGGRHRYTAIQPPILVPTATWEFNVIGKYDVYITWTDYPNHSTKQRFFIYDSTGLLGRYTVNQIGKPSGIIINDRPFQKLGTFDITGKLRVVTTNEATDGGYVTADAVALIEFGSIPVPPPVPPTPVSQFKITLRFPDNSITPNQQVIFQRAADRWSEIIIGDLPDARFNGYHIYPAADVDDVLIDAIGPYIDGPGGILGSAGPDISRPITALPVHGVMRFDSADIAVLEASGGLYYTCLHEIAHILGFGTLWQYKGLVNGNNFIGENAVREYGGPVPLETNGGSGTAGSHWAESVFANEIMTGYLNSGVNPVSRLTIASMVDLGYQVNMNAADPLLMQLQTVDKSKRVRID